MHPLFITPRKFLLAFSGWLIIVLSSILLQYSLLDCTWRAAFMLSTPPLVLLFFILLSNFFIARQIKLRQENFYLAILKHLAVAIMIIAFWLQMSMLYAESLVFITEDAIWRKLFSSSVALYALGGLLMYFVVLLLHYLHLETEYVHQVEQQALEVKLDAAKSELNALKMSVHPHFLFNSFNALNTLILTDSQKASQVTLQLSDFLRKSLQYAETEWTTVQEELDHVEDYLNIEKTRLGERLRIKFKVDEKVRGISLPPFTLLPIIENAVKHGIEQMVQGGIIALTLRREGQKLFCLVTNPYPKDKSVSVKSGFGLRALGKRLDTAYDQPVHLNEQKNDQVFALSFYLPLHNNPAKEL